MIEKNKNNNNIKEINKEKLNLLVEKYVKILDQITDLQTNVKDIENIYYDIYNIDGKPKYENDEKEKEEKPEEEQKEEKKEKEEKPKEEQKEEKKYFSKKKEELLEEKKEKEKL